MTRMRVGTASLLSLLCAVSPALAQTPCDSPRATCVQAVDALGRSHEECRERTASYKDLSARCQDQLARFENMRGNVDALVEDCKALRQTSASLADKHEQMLAKSKEIEGVLSQSLDLSKTSVRELDAAIVDLNEKYNTCVGECMTPIYYRFEFWAAVIGGVALGAFGATLVH